MSENTKNKNLRTQQETTTENTTKDIKTHDFEVIFGIADKKFYQSNELNNLNNIEKVTTFSSILENLENILVHTKDIVLEQILKQNLDEEYYKMAKENTEVYKSLITALLDTDFIDVTKEFLTPFYYKVKIKNYPVNPEHLKNPEVLKNLQIEIIDSNAELKTSDEPEINLIDILTMYLIILKEYTNLFNKLSEEELKLLNSISPQEQG